MNRPHAEYRGGEIYDLPADLAERWVTRGLAYVPGPSVPSPQAPVVTKAPETENHAAAEPEVTGQPMLVFGGKSHPGETPEEVITTDRTYIEWAASLYRDPAIKQRCKELLMATKK
jgi:hypothetical protein